jgi:2-polyprenyl-3-methyl-5-hydroxy-6-metoxy-1,4-benzoquinol methylase
MAVSNLAVTKIPACPVCRGRTAHYLFSVDHQRLVRCTQCGFTYQSPQPSDEVLGKIYSANYFLGAGEERQAEFARLKFRTAEHYLDELVAYSGLRNGRILEIGCGTGNQLLAAARRGFTVAGVEYSSHACETARSRLAAEGFAGEIICGEISQLKDHGETFDACIMADLIEHVRDPAAFIQQVHALLKPGGVVLIATPSLDSWSARFMGTSWMEFKVEHLSYFNRHTLESLLFVEGFREFFCKPGRKILSLDYVKAHFDKFPAKGFNAMVNLAASIVPQKLRRREVQVVASGILLMGRKFPKPQKPRLSIIVPAYNEAQTFAASFERVLAKDLSQVETEYVVIESNSTDGTRDIVKSFSARPNVKLIFQDRPQGKGNAVREGLKAATGDFILIQDADLEYDLDDYESLLEPLLTQKTAFVLGARHGGSAWKMRQFTGQPLTSMFLNFGHWFFTALLNLFFLVRLKDPFTMYKVFRRDCIHDLPLECNRFDFDWELVIKLIRRGYIPVEVPVNYRSRSFREGKKVSVIRDPLTWIVALVKFRLQSTRSLEPRRHTPPAA